MVALAVTDLNGYLNPRVAVRACMHVKVLFRGLSAPGTANGFRFAAVHFRKKTVGGVLRGRGLLQKYASAIRSAIPMMLQDNNYLCCWVIKYTYILNTVDLAS